MLYGKYSPILKSRTKTSLQTQLENLISLNSMDKEDSIMASDAAGSFGSGDDDDTEMVSSVEDTTTDISGLGLIEDGEGVTNACDTDTFAQVNDEAEDVEAGMATLKTEEPGVNDSQTEDEPGVPATKPPSFFRHLFNPKVLTDGSDANLDFMSLEMQCLLCLIKAPMTSMYCHAVDAHYISLCVYCLATFQHGRQLEVHLLREHRIQPSDFSHFYDTHAKIKSIDVEMFCSECNRSVTLKGKKDEDEVTLKEHNCNGDQVLCMKCARPYSLKDIAPHMASCQGNVKKKVNPVTLLPMFVIKQEPLDVDLVSSNENSPQKRSPQKSLPISPQKKIEPVWEPIGRLRNRDYKCKSCLEIVTPSTTAQHALECALRDLRRSGISYKIQSPVVSPEKALESPTSKSRTSSQKGSPRRNLGRLINSTVADTSNVNGGNEAVIDPQKIKLTDCNRTDCTDSGSNSTPLKSPSIVEEESCTVLESPAPTTSNTVAASPHHPQFSSAKGETTESAAPAPTQITKETAETSCDSNILFKDHYNVLLPSTNELTAGDQSPPPQLYGDALLNEWNPDKRRSILISELCDFLEDKHREEIRINDDMDMRKRVVDIYQSVTELTSDQIIELMISNCCLGCTYCRQSKVVGVDRRQLVVHLLTRHIWELKIHDKQNTPTGPEAASTADMNEVEKSSGRNLDWRQFKIDLLEKVFELTNHVFNFSNADPFGECPCECLLCGYQVITQKLLFPHWNKVHPGASMRCFLCHEDFLFAGALFSHLCFGTPQPLIKNDDPKKKKDDDSDEPKPVKQDESAQSTLSTRWQDGGPTVMMRYQCRLCDNLQFPGFFNFMVHLRADHIICELCLKPLADQKELQTHIFKKHRLFYYCWKCPIAYPENVEFFSHMFWKHGNSSVLCNFCGEKKWSFVYHFCRPPKEFECDICTEKFTRYTYLKVHTRLHSGENLRKCPKHNCQERFISKKLLNKHVIKAHNSNNVVTTQVAETDEAPTSATATSAGEKSQSPDPIAQAQECSSVTDEGTKQKTVFSEITDGQEIADAVIHPTENVSATFTSNNENEANQSLPVVETSSCHNAGADPVLATDAVTPSDRDVVIATTSQTCNGEDTSNQDENSTSIHASASALTPVAVLDSLAPDSPNDPNDPGGYESMAHVSPIHPFVDVDESVMNLENEVNNTTENEVSNTAPLDEELEESDRPFDISEFKGPNLSEDDDDNSDADLEGASKRSKTLTPLAFSDVEMETNSDKNQFSLDLNGHENYFDRIQSPDMTHYDRLLQEVEMDVAETPSVENMPSVVPNLSGDLSSVLSDTFQTAESTSENVQSILSGQTGQNSCQANSTILSDIQITSSSFETSQQTLDISAAEAAAAVDNKSSAASASKTDLMQDLLLSSDSDEDEQTRIEGCNLEQISSTNDCHGASVRNEAMHSTTTEFQTATENGVYEANYKPPESATASDGRHPSTESNCRTSKVDVDSPFKLRTSSTELPEHIIQEKARWCVENEHDYCLIPVKEGVGESSEKQHLKGHSELSERLSSGGHHQHKNEQLDTSQTARPKLKLDMTAVRKLKRSKSSSSSSSSSASSSASSSSATTTESSGSESDDDGKTLDEKSSTTGSRERSSHASTANHHQYNNRHSTSPYDSAHYAVGSSASPVTAMPAKRGRGRPKGSLNRDKFGQPTAKKFQNNRSGSSNVSRTVDDAYKPRRKYRKTKGTKGKVGRPKSTATLEKETVQNPEVSNVNTIPESDLETEDSANEEMFHIMQLSQPITDKIPASDVLWNLSNEEYLLRLVRGVESLEKLKQQAAKRLLEIEEQEQKRQVQASKMSPIIIRQQTQQKTSTPETSFHSASPPPVRQVRIKIGSGRARGRGRGRGRGARQSMMVDTRGNTLDTRAQLPVNHLVLGYENQYVHRTQNAPIKPAYMSMPIPSASSSHHQTMGTTTIAKKSDEEIWCVCRRPYEGRNMIQCEFKKCPFKWYHLDCIGLTQADVPKGSWYCKIDKCKRLRPNSPVTGKRKRQNERLVGHYTQ